MLTLLHPTPLAVDLADVVAFEDGTAIVAGDRGTLARIDAEGHVTPIPIPGLPTIAGLFEEMEAGSAKDFPGTEQMPIGLQRVLATRPDDLWVYGTSFLGHWNGRSWATTRLDQPAAGAELAPGGGGIWSWGGPCLGSAGPTHIVRTGDRLITSPGPETSCENPIRGLVVRGETLIALTDEALLRSNGATFESVRAEVQNPQALLEVGGRLLEVGDREAVWEDGTAAYKLPGFDWWGDARVVGREPWFFGTGAWRGAQAVPIEGLPRAALLGPNRSRRSPGAEAWCGRWARVAWSPGVTRRGSCASGPTGSSGR